MPRPEGRSTNRSGLVRGEIRLAQWSRRDRTRRSKGAREVPARGRQLYLDQGPSTEGPESTPRIVHFEVGESTEGSNNRRTSPRRKPATFLLLAPLASRLQRKPPKQPTGSGPATHKPPGKATKRPSPKVDPVAAAEGEVSMGGPSRVGEKKVAQSRPPRPPKTMKCPICGRVCHGLKVLNKHHREVHMGTRFTCGHCPRKFKTSSNRKKHEDKVCPSSHSPAGALRRAYFRSSSPEPKDGEGSVKGMRFVSSGEDLNNRSTGETDRGAQRPHAPRAPCSGRSPSR